MAPKAHEPVVDVKSPMPPGYFFLLKGNVYLTANCRKLTHSANKPLYVVTNSNKLLGIRVPAEIYYRVLAMERATRNDREEAVRKKDASMARKFDHALLEQFPDTPRDVVLQIVRHALVKGKKRVARNGVMKMKDKVRLAVTAHVRHCRTNYDKLLKAGVGREQARREVASTIAEVLRAWKGKAGSSGLRERNLLLGDSRVK